MLNEPAAPAAVVKIGCWATRAPLGIRRRVHELGGAIGSSVRGRTTGELDARLAQC
jgi:hypothetical protein